MKAYPAKDLPRYVSLRLDHAKIPFCARALHAKLFEGTNYLFFNYIKSIATADQQLTKIFNQISLDWIFMVL